MDLGKALQNEERRRKNRRSLSARMASAPEGQGFAVYGSNAEHEAEALEAAELLAKIVTKKVNRKLKPLQSTQYEGEDI